MCSNPLSSQYPGTLQQQFHGAAHIYAAVQVKHLILPGAHQVLHHAGGGQEHHPPLAAAISVIVFFPGSVHEDSGPGAA